MREYLRLWLHFYVRPRSFSRAVGLTRRPHAGLAASLQRALMDSLLLYLPLHLLGRVPPEPSYLGFIPDRLYYAALVGLAPVVLLAEWLLSAAVTHLLLRLLGRRSDMDHILNVSGLAALGIGTVLLVWDWLWVAAGGINQYTLGISHLAIDIWGVAITALALREILATPLWLGALLSVMGILSSLPIAIMFMRSPL